MSAPAKLHIVYYSTWNHIHTLALAVQRGAAKVPGVEVKLYQVRETLPDEVLQKMYAAPKDPAVPILEPAQLVEADGFLFGIPTRYGNLPAQWKTFWDATGGLWAKGALVGKMAGTFFSTGSQHGGQETTSLSLLSTLTHHGILFAPIGYAHPSLQDNSEVIGGSAWGAGTVSGGDGSRQPSEKELAIAEFQGEQFAKTLAQYIRGKQV